MRPRMFSCHVGCDRTSATNPARCCYDGQKPGPLENKILSCVCPACVNAISHAAILACPAQSLADYAELTCGHPGAGVGWTAQNHNTGHEPRGGTPCKAMDCRAGISCAPAASRSPHWRPADQ